MTSYDNPGTVQFRLGGLVRQLSVPEFGTVLGLYTEEFKEENDLHALNRHIHRSPSRCWDALVSGGATYNSSRSKASALPPPLRYLHAILAHTIAGSMRTPPSQPPPPSNPVHVTASYADISERLTRFEQQYFQRFDNIDATLQQICYHLHISSTVPPCEPSSDEDVRASVQHPIRVGPEYELCIPKGYPNSTQIRTNMNV
ncbi:hypothetical protein GOBAR_AA10900 [Gossypium barbadense]|uniref:Uncharacterized protein n=1 Tax=Gossypium barbadense TaxID=3634 RepID=A0A2P5Y2C5_GOSBA|nr:hypothetical protein GOBAR_AA10900 [Gossypium barbadense]